MANEYAAKFYRLANAIIEGRTDGALIRVTTPISRDEREDAADQRLQEFMSDAMPKLSSFVPARSVR